MSEESMPRARASDQLRARSDSRRPWRVPLAAGLVRGTATLSRHLRLGSGSTVGGHVGLVLDKDLLAHLSANKTVLLISGTNGKTTTTRLAATALSRLGAVATSGAGANMDAGLVSALAAEPMARFAVLEVDEAHLPHLLVASAASVVILLNLSRDQLDRTSEVRMLADRWRQSFRDASSRVVANADDPLVTWAVQLAPRVTWVAAGGNWHDDAYHCPACDERIAFPKGPGEGWSCTCGFERPSPDFTLVGDELVGVKTGPVQIRLSIPGRFNLANAAMAAIASATLGDTVEGALAAMRDVEEIAGRFSMHHVAGRSGSLLLAKNPAGWAELIDLVAPGTAPIVIGINARLADGHDPSWLWDVPFERLASHLVVATGDRRRDLAVRLLHAGVEHLVAEDPLVALAHAGKGPIEFIGNYTAFQDLRKTIAREQRASGTVLPRPTPARSVAGARLEDRACEPAAQLRRAGRAPGVSSLRIVVVHPDLLGTYGDGGNGLVLANRAHWRDIPVELIYAPSDAPLPRGADIYCLGGGEDGPQLRAAARLRDGSLAAAVECGATVLAVCAGYQILGHSFPGPDGRATAGIGLLDVTTVRGEPRAVGDVIVSDPLGHVATGFENHAGRTSRGAGLDALGTVSSGIGNGDGTDGARTARILATYLHGPVLARNAWLADHLLSSVIAGELAPLDDRAEAILARQRIAAAGSDRVSIGEVRRRILQQGVRALVSRK
jgi:CobQ-like glutamine amidotransferase family enzyme/UDP-N-acetylmuramyl tripeptide synthase